ncbi:uncharacterized protein LOC144225308 [Crocuta crocuta]
MARGARLLGPTACWAKPQFSWLSENTASGGTTLACFAGGLPSSGFQSLNQYHCMEINMSTGPCSLRGCVGESFLLLPAPAFSCDSLAFSCITLNIQKRACSL